MKLSLYLKGGGAKGAFQAGVLKSLCDRGIKFSHISGTSIGAVNGYFLFHNALDKMEELYTKSDDSVFLEMKLEGKTIENKNIMDQLENVSSKSQEKSVFLVNYVKVKNSILTEVTENIAGMSKEEMLERIKWSSLLPYNKNPMTLNEFIDYFKSHDVLQEFNTDLKKGVYDNLELDGGMINNFVIKEIFDYKPDKLLIIGYNGTREENLKSIPFSINFNADNIIYISRDIPFNVTDTYDFSSNFLKRNFEEGYKVGNAFDISTFES